MQIYFAKKRIEMISEIFTFLANLFMQLGYFGIFILMTLESSFIPFSSEIVMIPAGILAATGKLNLWFAVFCGVLGSLAGALINYIIGKYLGRNYLLKHHKLFFLKEKHLIKTESFFKKYGNLATFFGRLVPVVRQYISLPAGFANMKLVPFIIYTCLGAFIWVLFLALIGFYIGDQLLIKGILNIYNLIIIGIIVIGVIFFVIWYLKKKKNN